MPKSETGWMTRDKTLAFILVVLTALAAYLCFLLAWPFLSALAWALALAVIAHPVHRYLSYKIRNDDVSAAVTLLIVALFVVLPALFVVQQIAREAAGSAAMVREQAESGEWKRAIERNPTAAPVLSWIETNIDVRSEVENIVKETTARIPKFLSASVWAGMELLITFLVLFYFFRDRRSALGLLESLSPLTHDETERMFRRISETIHVTVFGTLVVALVQGSLGALMFWWLGLPAPLLWGGVMALLSIIPLLGAFVVWIPAAIYLALQADYGKALMLAVWGGVVIALIDNLLYPVLVGNRLQLHTLPVFFSIVGGFIVFGASGLILGPVVLAVTVALIEVWRARTRGGHSVEEAA
ncbi:MAG TPA: AI-2E family transporter [Burkholderiales bacterium]|nr:AI-2E family transporter [Burkholderiales bacterium]